MNDEELPINDELASAYLDDELDATERAAASADPEVMATVEGFARVRAALGKVAPVDGSAKDDALAAALAEFDALQIAATAAAPMATVTSLQSRRRAYRALTGVAAAVAILAIGVAAINTRGGDTKSSAVERNAAPAATIAPSAADAPSLKAVADTGAAAGTAAPAAESVAAASQAGDATAGATTAGLPQVDNDDALIQYASQIEGHAAPSPQSPTTTVPADGTFGPPPVACLTSHQVVLGGPISVNGNYAYAVRDQGNGALQAIDATDCTVLLEVPGP